MKTHCEFENVQLSKIDAILDSILKPSYDLGLYDLQLISRYININIIIINGSIYGSYVIDALVKSRYYILLNEITRTTHDKCKQYNILFKKIIKNVPKTQSSEVKNIQIEKYIFSKGELDQNEYLSNVLKKQPHLI